MNRSQSLSVLIAGVLAVGMMTMFAGPIAAAPGDTPQNDDDTDETTGEWTIVTNEGNLTDNDTVEQIQIQYNNQTGTALEAGDGDENGDEASVTQTNDQDADQSVVDVNDIDQSQAGGQEEGTEDESEEQPDESEDQSDDTKKQPDEHEDTDEHSHPHDDTEDTSDDEDEAESSSDDCDKNGED